MEKKQASKKSKSKKSEKNKQDSPLKVDHPAQEIPGQMIKSSLPATQMPAIPDQVTDKMIDDFLFGSETTLTKEHKVLFKKTALAFQLNPFKREIYAIPYKIKGVTHMNIITGYEVYLKRAERSGRLDGWKCWTEGTVQNNLKACIDIYRKDFREPLHHEVYYSEYVQTFWNEKTKKRQPNTMWATKPMTMIKKVAMAQGFRLAFPDDIGGMPYTSDELPVKGEPIRSDYSQGSSSISEPIPVSKSESDSTWGKEETELFEKMKGLCKVAGLSARDLKEKYFKPFKVNRFQELNKKQLKQICDDINNALDEADSQGGDANE